MELPKSNLITIVIDKNMIIKMLSRSLSKRRLSIFMIIVIDKNMIIKMLSRRFDKLRDGFTVAGTISGIVEHGRFSFL